MSSPQLETCLCLPCLVFQLALVRKVSGVSTFEEWGIRWDLLTPECKIIATPTQSTNVKPAKGNSQQAMVEAKQTWSAWSREISEKRGQSQKGKMLICWHYTKYTIEESTITDIQSKVTRAITEVTPRWCYSSCQSSHDITRHYTSILWCIVAYGHRAASEVFPDVTLSWAEVVSLILTSMPIKNRMNNETWLLKEGGGQNLHTHLDLMCVCPVNITFITGVSCENQNFQNVMQGLQHSASKSLAMLEIGSHEEDQPCILSTLLSTNSLPDCVYT